MSVPLTLDIADGIATITYNRPDKLNAMTPEMATLMIEAVTTCNASDAVRCVILTGTGRAFCAGSDISELDRYATPWDFRNRPEYCDALRALLKPSIAAVNGYAMGGGLEMALSCDIRIASEVARFAAPEIKLGWIGGGGMTALLAHSVGPSNAAMMVMTGDLIDADKALAWGLVSELTAPETLQSRAREIAATIASRAPIAAETARANLKAAYNMPLEQAVAYERDLQAICFATEDAREGRAAFESRRPPVFHRR
ncbi:enoyl-CoA hydratase/isomerase family protein [Pseudooceanicola sediminis]|uniref:Enoyl-CoA hydratase/isomerase family protein n=1 Tax=Pseudooceanicola sediminis TaxID=2211117 RepID=A0A399J4I3_9RHOB|nr:enoyl-CoA hydratase/isomerase family protein [Pseudooceanicola sediminis]KAA2315068.1 enoyl-CoA hydratase/isomerase family protein [Puniceibacterium sp. HSS470]RII38882.1 enoyl-CoA hydratase/isomerase family protein [Pseudooceanicola sediminis]|tara:strand:- start:8831 stop:9598 length:768 start_codon:yes stop_codon:yes gene_type:complete